uniref:CG-1 domain-containing protein n=1 Tax=Solanum lycopersicum TaxID=4081 RepID=A0A3Q7GHQ7_SOLLC
MDFSVIKKRILQRLSRSSKESIDDKVGYWISASEHVSAYLHSIINSGSVLEQSTYSFISKRSALFEQLVIFLTTKSLEGLRASQLACMVVPCFYLIGIWKVLRDFRNGHHWRKKKDGEIVNETHEKMKISSKNMRLPVFNSYGVLVLPRPQTDLSLCLHLFVPQHASTGRIVLVQNLCKLLFSNIVLTISQSEKT